MAVDIVPQNGTARHEWTLRRLSSGVGLCTVEMCKATISSHEVFRFLASRLGCLAEGGRCKPQHLASSRLHEMGSRPETRLNSSVVVQRKRGGVWSLTKFSRAKRRADPGADAVACASVSTPRRWTWAQAGVGNAAVARTGTRRFAAAEARERCDAVTAPDRWCVATAGGGRHGTGAPRPSSLDTTHQLDIQCFQTATLSVTMTEAGRLQLREKKARHSSSQPACEPTNSSQRPRWLAVAEARSGAGVPQRPPAWEGR